MANFFSGLLADLASLDTSVAGQVGIPISVGGQKVSITIPLSINESVSSVVGVASALGSAVSAGHVTVDSALTALVALFSSGN